MLLKLALTPVLAVSLFALTSVKKEMTTSQNATEVTKKSKSLLSEPVVTNLMAGQNMVAGTITAVADEDAGTLTVTYATTGNWTLTGFHLYAGTTPGIPVGNSGNPRIGHFPYKSTTLSANTTTYTVVIPLANMPADIITIAAHATVTGPSNQTGWGQGPQINDGGSWAMKFFVERDQR